MLDPVVIWYAPHAEYRGISPSELKEVSDYFERSILSALEVRYPVVTEPGPFVLRVRAAITGVTPTRPDPRVSGRIHRRRTCKTSCVRPQRETTRCSKRPWRLGYWIP